MKRILSRFFSVVAFSILVCSAFAALPYARRMIKDSDINREGYVASQSTVADEFPRLKGVIVLKSINSVSGSFAGFSKASTNLTTSFSTTNQRNKVAIKGDVPAGDIPTLIGCNIWHSGGNWNYSGLFTIPTNPDYVSKNIASGAGALNGGVLKDGIYYGTHYYTLFGNLVITVSRTLVETGEKLESLSPSDFASVLVGAAYDATSDNIYAIGYNSVGDGQQLSIVKYTDKDVVVTAVAPVTKNVNSLVCDGSGQLYAITFDAEGEGDDMVVTKSYLQKVDKNTGAFTLVGETGFAPQYETGAAIDPKSGRMFWTVSQSDHTSYLTEVNLTTGAATAIYEFPNKNEFTGVQILPPAAEAKAPAAVTDARLDFPKGTLTGHVSFNVPDTCFDGSKLTGDVKYTVLANGKEVSADNVAVGSTVNAEVTLPAPGNYEFVIYTANAIGKSPNTRLKSYIGNGIPGSPKPVLAYENKKLTLSWDAVTESEDGGYIDASAVKYSVYDRGGKAVAENISATSWSMTLEAPDSLLTLRYSVVAECNGMTSESAESNIIVIGSIIPPYINNFETEERFAEFTVIDANNDGQKWKYYPGEDGFGSVPYHRYMKMDDWLVTAPIKVEAGMAYNVSVDLKARNATDEERFEIYYGSAADPESLNKVLVETTTTKSTEYKAYGGYIYAESDGYLYVGIHGCSDNNRYFIDVDNFSIEKGIKASLPAKTGDLSVTPASYGELSSTLSFTAPSVSVAGKDLDKIEKIEVVRNGEVVSTIENVVPGRKYNLEDKVNEAGWYEYSVSAYNGGKGEMADKKVYIGLSAPASVTGLSVKTDNCNVTLTWNPSSVDINGTPIRRDQALYTIWRADRGQLVEKIAENLKDTTYTFKYDVPVQEFLQFGIQTSNEAGVNPKLTGSALLAVGPAYKGLEESFVNGQLSHIWGTSSEGGAGWNAFIDGQFEGVNSRNGDNGFIGCGGNFRGANGLFFSGVVSLKELINPTLEFYVYLGADDGYANKNTIDILLSVPNSGEWKQIKTITLTELEGFDKWVKVSLPLDEYTGKDIQFGLKGTIISKTWILVDDIRLKSDVDYDLAVKSISAPESVNAGFDYNVSVEIANEGTKAAENFMLQLYENGKLVDSKSVESLKPDTLTNVSFVRNLSPLVEDTVEYYAKVEFINDRISGNNTTKKAQVAPVASNLPAVTDLAGEVTGEGNRLHWTQPDVDSYLPDSFTEDFENAESWAHSYSDWIFVDADDSPVAGFSGLTIPGITPGETKSSWFVFDASGKAFNNTYTASSGVKYLASLFRLDLGTVDDWAISPELKGVAQTVSFKAKCYNPEYPEAFEVYYSSGSTDIRDFVKLGGKVTLNEFEWQTFSYDLPKGAKRFAVRSCATNSFMIMLDDFCYIPGNTPDLKLLGYDIYRDGIKLNKETVKETSYVDREVEKNRDFRYNVVASYQTGLSAGSNTLTLSTSSIIDVKEGIIISGGKGKVEITGGDGLSFEIFSMDDIVAYRGVSDGDVMVSLSPGIYIVRAGEKIVKVLVR